MDDIGDITNGLPAGRYPYDVNPDLRTRADEVTVSTLVSDRVVLSAAYADALQENESGGLARRTRTADANFSWRASPALLFVARYDWDREASEDLSASARELRRRNNAAHVTGGLTHQQALEPWDARRLADLQARWAAGGAWELGGRVGWRAREQYAVLRKVAGAWVDEAEKTTATFAAVDARVRPAAGLALDGSAGLEKTDDPGAQYSFWSASPPTTFWPEVPKPPGSPNDPAGLGTLGPSARHRLVSTPAVRKPCKPTPSD